jgi:hypothetical protein
VDKEEMYSLASALTKLTTAVEEKVLFKEAPAEMKDMALVDFSTSHDPRLKEPFVGYLLKAQGVNGHAVVLVCDQSGSKGLLEDGGCSSVVDKQWWRDQPDHPCEISTQMCTAKQVEVH